jgi:hypothetical protein
MLGSVLFRLYGIVWGCTLQKKRCVTPAETDWRALLALSRSKKFAAMASFAPGTISPDLEAAIVFQLALAARVTTIPLPLFQFRLLLRPYSCFLPSRFFVFRQS